MSHEPKNHDYGAFRGQNFDKENNQYVSGRDESGRQSLNTLYGDHIIANRKPSLAAQFQYGLASGEATPDLAGTGAFVIEDSMLKLSTGASASSHAKVQSTDYLRYIPGHEGYVYFSAVFTTPVAGSMQRAGLYDVDNGFAIGYTDTDFEFVILRDGVETQMIIDISEVFDPQDGIFDPMNGNQYRITFSYGFGPVALEVMSPTGGWVLAAELQYPNTQTQTHILQTFLPLRAEVINTTNDTNIEFKTGSLSAGLTDGSIVPGSATDPSARSFTKAATPDSGTSGSIIAFRNKTTFNSVENRVPALLKLVSCASDGAKSVRWRLLKQPAFISATWNDINATDSTLEFSEDLVLDTGAEDGETFLNWNMAKVDTFFQDVAEQNLLLPPGGVAVFYFESDNSTDVELAIRWAELF